jgi:hypothetical protein
MYPLYNIVVLIIFHKYLLFWHCNTIDEGANEIIGSTFTTLGECSF